MASVERVGQLIYGANKEMVRIESVRSANEQAGSHFSLEQVAIFVGGTSGIGESTINEFFRRIPRPKAYILGRNVERGNQIIEQLKLVNPQGTAILLLTDISLIRNVDIVCAELSRREKKINQLFLTAGYLTLRGRNETIEGLDRKMAVNYYARIRFILNLMPLLTVASEANELSRVITVLAAGSEGDIRLDDLDLQHNFTLHACLAHCVVLSDFMIEEFAKRHPGTAFSHSYPGTVKTGIATELSGPVRLAVKVLYSVLTPWILNVKESGERHFFQMTNACYPAANVDTLKTNPRPALPIPEGISVMRGSDGRLGSGAYLLDWDGKTTGNRALLDKYRALDFGKTAWDHTMEMFARAEQRMRKEGKRLAAEEAEGSGRDSPHIPGWRPS